LEIAKCKLQIEQAQSVWKALPMYDPPKYTIMIYWSTDDEAFIAEVPELPGCAADGTTYQEALSNVEIVIEEWIQTAKELGRPVPEPKGRLLFA
jgi:predicted RNase H-like HicB family nuclease